MRLNLFLVSLLAGSCVVFVFSNEMESDNSTDIKDEAKQTSDVAELFEVFSDILNDKTIEKTKNSKEKNSVARIASTNVTIDKQQQQQQQRTGSLILYNSDYLGELGYDFNIDNNYNWGKRAGYL
uniref:Uncharacterized protein n=1 Tax=Glossina pallidipes TaxID=7398 RepID=A0A1B0AJW9_GLOPL